MVQVSNPGVRGTGDFCLKHPDEIQNPPSHLFNEACGHLPGRGTWLWHDVDHLHLVLGLRISGAISVLCSYTFIAWTETSFTFTVCFVGSLLISKNTDVLLQSTIGAPKQGVGGSHPPALK
jgi:hypothetical protein